MADPHARGDPRLDRVQPHGARALAHAAARRGGRDHRLAQADRPAPEAGADRRGRRRLRHRGRHRRRRWALPPPHGSAHAQRAGPPGARRWRRRRRARVDDHRSRPAAPAQPRGRARARGRGRARPARCPRRSRCSTASRTSASTRTSWRASRPPTSPSSASATCRWPRRAGADGATTVAATAHLAARAGIRVFATGGLGGVHRDARESWDESADLLALARTPITVVAAGVKSILDVGATLERLETLGVGVAGWRTEPLPGLLPDRRRLRPRLARRRTPTRSPRRWRRPTSWASQSALVVANPIAAARAARPRRARARPGRRARARAGGRRHRQGGDALPARPPAPRDRRALARGQHRGRARQRGGGGRHRGGLGGARVILVVGDVMDDLVVRPLGPLVPRSDTPAHMERHPGGSGANTAAWLGVLGAEVRFAGRVGLADLRRHARALEACGVDARLAGDARTPTGSIVVLAHDRSMFTDRGANLALGRDDLPDDLLEGVDHVHVSGYSLLEEGPRSAVLDLVARAGVPWSVDPASPAFVADTPVPGVDRRRERLLPQRGRGRRPGRRPRRRLRGRRAQARARGRARPAPRGGRRRRPGRDRRRRRPDRRGRRLRRRLPRGARARRGRRAPARGRRCAPRPRRSAARAPGRGRAVVSALRRRRCAASGIEGEEAGRVARGPGRTAARSRRSPDQSGIRSATGRAPAAATPSMP